MSTLLALNTDEAEPLDWLALLLRLGIAAAVLWVLYHLLLRPRADFVITVRNGQVDCRGSIPLHARVALEEFLTQDLELQGNIKIMGDNRNGRLTLWFTGPLTAGQKQRIRNYLLTSL